MHPQPSPRGGFFTPGSTPDKFTNGGITMSMFYMPVKVYEENNAIANHAKEIAAFGRKALIVTGRRSAFANGSYPDLTAALESQGVDHVVFNEVEENPSVHTIMKARDFGLAANVDFVIGIGGGSPLDASKAIALMIKKADKDAGYLYKPDGDSETLPIVAIPTTCGTGSEVTPVSVLTDTDKQIKKSIPHKIFANLALLDGKYLKNAPRRVLCNTAFDALTHLIESYLNSKATDYSRMCVDAGLKIWARSQPVIRGEKAADDADLLNMLRASMMAGMAIAHTATTIPHGLSYAVTTHLGVPHGMATAYFTAGYLTEAPETDRDYLLGTAGFASIEDFRETYHASCGQIQADEDRLREVLDTVAAELAGNPAKMALAPFDVTPEIVRKIAYFELDH